MQEKNRFIEKVKAQIAEWDAKFDESGSDLRALSRDQVERMKLKRDALKHKLGLLADATDDAWDDLRKGIENAWDELRHAFDDDKNKRDGASQGEKKS